MFFKISLVIGIVLTFASMLACLILCFMSGENKHRAQLMGISTQFRWIGLVYMVLAWFVSGEKAAVGASLTTISSWLRVFSNCWIALFAVSLIAKMFGKGDRKAWHLLATALFCFIIAYLID